MSSAAFDSARGQALTLLSAAFSFSASALAGFRSLARTAHPFFPAGIANGPTPANPSTMTSSGEKVATSRACSVWRREFQYTFEKSKRNLQSCSACGREDNEGSVGAQEEVRGELAHHLDDKVGVAGEDLHLKVAVHVVNHVEFVDDGPELGVLLLVRALGRQQGVLGGWTRREGYARRG